MEENIEEITEDKSLEIYKYVSDRITFLRMRKKVSERQMSEDLGRGASYIQQVVSQRSKIQLHDLKKVCDYFDISLPEFFDPFLLAPDLVKEATNTIKLLKDDDIQLLTLLAEKLNGKSEK